MKKFIVIVLFIALIATLSASLAACKKTPRDEKLKIYMPGDYIDEEIVSQFESWYKRETGKNRKRDAGLYLVSGQGPVHGRRRGAASCGDRVGAERAV